MFNGKWYPVVSYLLSVVGYFPMHLVPCTLNPVPFTLHLEPFLNRSLLRLLVYKDVLHDG